jgi:hypothetical protein
VTVSIRLASTLRKQNKKHQHRFGGFGFAVGAFLVIGFVSSVNAINITFAEVQNGVAVVKGNKAAKNATIIWENANVAKTNNGGAFSFSAAVRRAYDYELSRVGLRSAHIEHQPLHRNPSAFGFAVGVPDGKRLSVDGTNFSFLGFPFWP